MSLVNKMLRDLDARRAGALERGSLLTAVSPLPDDEDGKGASIGLIAFAIIGVSLAAAIQFNWPPLQSLITRIAHSINPPPPVAVPKTFAPTAATAAPVTEPATAPAAVAEGTTAVSPAPTLAAAPPPLAEKPVTAKAASNSAVKPPAKAVAKPKSPPAKVAPVAKAPPPTKPAQAARHVAKPGSPATAAVPTSVPAAAGTVAGAAPATASADGTIDKQMNRPPPHERAEAEYRQGMQAQRQGSVDEALARYRRALADQPEHVGARQALSSLLIEQRRFDDAEAQLRSGLEVGAARLTFATMLARLKVERGEPQAALDILLQHSAAGERSADYQGFVAVLQNRAGRHGEAASRYRAATRLAPSEARWWAGLAIALESDGKPQEAREAYQQARTLPGLAPELAAHIEQRLR